MYKQADSDSCNFPADYDKLAAYDQEYLCHWIETHIVADTKENNRDSYSLKHVYSKQMYALKPNRGDFYITNGQFKGAMLACGFEPVDASDLNWSYRIQPAYPKAWD